MPAYLCSFAAMARAEDKAALISDLVLPAVAIELKNVRTAGSDRAVSRAITPTTIVVSVSVIPLLVRCS
jgi:hypothetical protein